MEPAIESLVTLRDFVRWGASRFNEAQLHFGHGTDNALDEALVLVLHALHLPPDLPVAYLGARLTPSERQAVVGLLRRRLEECVPAAYLTHRAWFAGLELYVDERVLVPRSPFAELIGKGFAPWVDAGRVHRLLDLCTGSGCIGIAAAMHLPEAQVDLTDVSEPALAVARRNVRDFGLEQRVRVIRSDLFAGLAGQRYDLILCNPPYVAEEELAALPMEYQREPSLGLAGGRDGLDLVRRILRAAGRHLEPGGAIILEVGSSAAALQEMYPEVAFLWLEFEHGGEGVLLLTAEQAEELSDLACREIEGTP
jgi:ribosomal protein L3 glutamine methyltransferase